MRWRRQTLVTWLVFAMSMGAVGCKQISRKSWISEMRKKAPQELCKDGTYFRVCFKVTRQECEAAIEAATATCLEKYRSQIPRTLMQPQDGRKWGQKVGACAGSAYDKKMVAKQQLTAKCRAVLQALKKKP